MTKFGVLVVCVFVSACGPYEGYSSYDEAKRAFCNPTISDFDFYERLKETKVRVVDPVKMTMILRRGCPDPFLAQRNLSDVIPNETTDQLGRYGNHD